MPFLGGKKEAGLKMLYINLCAQRLIWKNTVFPFVLKSTSLHKFVAELDKNFVKGETNTIVALNFGRKNLYAFRPM